MIRPYVEWLDRIGDGVPERLWVYCDLMPVEHARSSNGADGNNR
jgi:hypothetical protein